MKKSHVAPLAISAIFTVFVVGAIATGSWIANIFNAPAAPPAPIPSMSSPAEVAEDSTETSDTTFETTESASNTELLQYLIEEEKLAHDVYVTLNDIWPSNVLANITSSEITHQDRVAGLLDSYGITDPRSATVGEFTNPELQALYDELVAQGSVSQQAAFEVGVAIEELDISDIDEMLTTVDDPQVASVLESLRSASEKHLAAFERQLS
ncbi:MAG: DUF2202 domain-containing protein [Microbacteriaceae bacterium]